MVVIRAKTHVRTAAIRGLLTYVAGRVEPYHLVGHAPDVRGRNDSGHLQLQREDVGGDLWSNAGS
jgi:hypothetical protein